MSTTEPIGVGTAGPDGTSTGSAPLLAVENMSIHFATNSGEVCALRDLSFTVRPGQTVGLVGESGSGKSITGLALMGLLGPRARVTGTATLGRKDPVDLLAASPARLAKLRGSAISMIFQDAMTALDPVFTVGRQIVETIRAHRDVSRQTARRQAVELLDSVGIPLVEQRLKQYPHELSGGMRQRVMIAIALACEPSLIIADEPTTALDMTVQAQILDLLRQLSSEHGTAVLLVSHDLGVIAEMCSEVLTMYAGELVERSPVDDVLERPRHPYTSGLIRAIPSSIPSYERLYSIPGRVPPLDAMPPGCRFHPRCEHAEERCVETAPVLDHVVGHHEARCLRAAELRLPGAVVELVGEGE